MIEMNDFLLYDVAGNRIYTVRDIDNLECKPLSYNSIRSIARRFNIGFKKHGMLFFTEKDLKFM